MKTKRIVILLAVLGFFISNINAQSDTEWRSGKQVNDVYSHNWSFGAGINMVDDSGTKLGAIPDGGKRMSLGIPIYANAEYYLNNKFSFNAMISLNKYTEGVVVDKMAIILKDHEASYAAFDLAAKLYFRDWLKTYKFDPYVFVGFGYTNIGGYKGEPVDYVNIPDYVEIDENGNIVVPTIGRMTVNTGVGFNIWFSQTWGLNLNLAGKWGMGNGDYEAGSPLGTSNQMQYAFGVVYFLN